MYVTRIPNRNSPPAVLLRESYREGGKVKSRTLANISDWPEAKVESLRRVLAGEILVPLAAERFEIARALAHGHVAAVLGTVRRLGLDKMLPNGPERRAKLIVAMIVARIIEPAAKLATARQLSEATAAHSLGAMLGLGEVDEDELYAALDLLGRSQAGVEKILAQRHLKDGVLVLYDVTSSYLEGRRCDGSSSAATRSLRPSARASAPSFLEATENALIKIRAMTERKRNPLRGEDKIALKVGAVVDRRHMAKHFDLAIIRHRPRLLAQGRGDRRGSRARRRLLSIRSSLPTMRFSRKRMRSLPT